MPFGAHIDTGRPPAYPACMTIPPEPPPSGQEHETVSTPGVADGRERQLDPRSVTVERIGGAIGAALMSLPLVIGTVSGALFGSLGLAGRVLLVCGGLLIALLLFARALYWPGLAFRYAFWRADERGLRIRRGVIWRTEIFVPKSRVQHTDVSRGPIERGFGLAKLVMHTAGTHDASVVLEGLAEADAFALRDFLIDVDGGDAV